MNYKLYYRLKYLIHPLGWAFLYILPYLFSFEGLPNAFTLFTHPGDYIHLVSFILLIAFAYANHLFFMPEYYLKSKYLVYVIVVAVSFWIVINLRVHLIPKSLFNRERPLMDRPPQPILFGRNYTILLFIASVFASISIYIRERLQEIEKDRLSAELSLLKAQINPHFLFNTLNSIYALVINKDEKAGDAVVHLAELMRYIIKEAEGDYVSLDKEIQYIEHYIALQDARLGDTVNLSCSIEGNFGNKKIAPLLLLTFIENAFKHGVNPNEPSEIKIVIHSDENEIRLFVKNKKVSISNKEGGLGLKNVNERLKLLYPTNHILKINDNRDTYSTDLIIKL